MAEGLGMPESAPSSSDDEESCATSQAAESAPSSSDDEESCATSQDAGGASSLPSRRDPATAASVTSEGNLLYGNERQMLTELGRFYNSQKLSDVKLRVGDNVYLAHKLVLVRASNVLEQMLCSDNWKDNTKQEVELNEDPECQRVFSTFLRYFYTCHVELNQDNALPVLVLAKKYNVYDLKSVCVQFSLLHVIPNPQSKDVFRAWFQYATRCFHRQLISACVSALSKRMDDHNLPSEWEEVWVNLEWEEVVNYLMSSELTVKDEWHLWMAVQRWLQAPFPNRMDELEWNLSYFLPRIRFGMMSVEQLYELEHHALAEQFREPFELFVNEAYKYHALPLGVRAKVKEFNRHRFLLRNYSELRWDKRIVVADYWSSRRTLVDLNFDTRGCSCSQETWNWELLINPKESSDEGCWVCLRANLDQGESRLVEYSLSIVDEQEQEQRAVMNVNGKENFYKNSHSENTEVKKQLNLEDLRAIDSPYQINDNLVVQVVIRPIIE